MMQPLRPYFTSFISLLLGACITINVYFPAAAAEKAADRIIDQVWGEEQKSKEPEGDKPQPSQDKTSQVDKTLLQASTTFFLTEEWLTSIITTAYAEANIDISSPSIQALKNSMSGRFRQLKAFYDSGVVGLTSDGLVAVRDAASVPLRSRTEVNRLVNDENQDRLNLYKEIAVANNHPEWESNIRAVFATRWIERAQKGWWYQSRGQWLQK